MMKKFFAVCAAALMLTIPVFAGEVDYTGDWYGDFNGLVIKMTFDEDGTYVMDFAGFQEEGTWELTDEGIAVDDDSTGILTEEGLEMTDADGLTMILGRDEIENFVPAEIDYEADLDLLQGKWSAYKVGADGSYLNVAPGDVYATDMEITGTTVKMNGFYFEDETFEMEMQDGGLSLFSNDESDMFEIIAINYLEDGTLRLGLTISLEEDEGLEYFFIPAEEIEGLTEAVTE